MLDARFAQIVRRHLRYLPPERDLAADAPLRDLGLDSMAAVALLLTVEEEFAVTLPDEPGLDETLRTAGTLWAALDSARNG